MRSTNIRCSVSAEGVELAILGDITPYTAEDIMRAVSFFKGQPITIMMMSGGGDAFASLGLYDFLKGKDVTVRVYGIAASGAAIISAAAKRVEMAAGSYMMIHEAYSLGDGPDHVTESINERQVEVFAAKSGKTRDKVRKMLAAETYMDAPTAKAEGFADAVFDPLKVAASINKMQRMEDVIKTEEAAEVVATVETPEAHAADPGDEQPEPVEAPAEAVAETEEVEVEIPVSAAAAIQAALKGKFKAKVNVGKHYGEIVAMLTDELKTVKAQLDEANAKVEDLQPKAEAAAAAEKVAEEASAKVAEVTAEVEKLKETPLAPAVVPDAAPAAVVPAAPVVTGPAKSQLEGKLEKNMSAIDAAIARRGVK